MERLLSAVIHRPIAVSACFITILVLGVAALLRLSLSLRPDTEYPALTISASWPGASSEAVVKDVTAVIEAAAASVTGVASVRSTSREGNAQIQAQFSPQTDMTAARTLLTERLSALRADLPVGVVPRVSEAPPEVFKDLEGFLTYSVVGRMNDADLRRLALEIIRPALLAVDGVSGVEVIGGREEELHITLDPETLEKLDLSPRRIQAALHQAFQRYAVGAFHQHHTTASVWAEPVETRLEAIAQLPVAVRPGQVRTLGDMANVKVALAPPRSIARIDGLPAITMHVSRRPGANILEAANAVQRRIARLADRLPSDVRMIPVLDRSEDVRLALSDLALRAALALIAIWILLLVFLRRALASFIVLSAIFFSVLGAMICFDMLGIGLDLLSISGLALAFGIVVDNAVVVYENIRRRQEEGGNPETAIVNGTSEMLTPVITTTLTTVVALVPVIYLSGDLKRFVTPFAIGLGLTLFVSVAVAATWIPMMAYRITRRAGSSEPGRFWARLSQAYGNAVGFSLKWRWPIMLLTLTLFGGSVYLFVTGVWKGPAFSWRGESTFLSVWIDGPPGTEIAALDQVAQSFETLALASGREAVQVTTRIQEETATVQVDFTPEAAQSALPYLLKTRMENLATHFGGLYIGVTGYGIGFSTGGAVGFSAYFRVRGYNYDDLRDHAEKLAQRLARHPRVRNVADTNQPRFRSDAYYEMRLVPSRRILGQSGLSVLDLNDALSARIAHHAPSGFINMGDTRIPYRLAVAGATTEEELARMRITGPGRVVRMADVGQMVRQRVPSAILRSDQQYERWITYEFVGPSRMAERYVESFLNAVDLPPGYQIDRGWFSWQEDDPEALYLALGLAVILVLLTTAALFESLRSALVVLLTVPMGLTGIFAVFWMFDLTFDRGAYLGMIFLTGIVVNSAIIMVDRISRLRREGAPRDQAIRTACRQRLRPILITSITTLVGLTPLLIAGHPSTRDLWTSLSYTGLSGLVVATLLVLFVTPPIYRSLVR